MYVSFQQQSWWKRSVYNLLFNKQSCATCASSLAPSTVTSFLVPVLCLMNCPFASILAGAFYCLSEDQTPENQRDSGSLAFVISVGANK
jgi:hypothetical protein